MALPQVSLEKRLLPLLDVTLILVGILILVMGNPELGQSRVFIVPIYGDQLLYEDMVIYDGAEILVPNAQRMLRIAISADFYDVVIESKQGVQLSGSKIEEIEQQLQKIAQRLAQEEAWSQSLTIHAQ